MVFSTRKLIVENLRKGLTLVRGGGGGGSGGGGGGGWPPQNAALRGGGHRRGRGPRGSNGGESSSSYKNLMLYATDFMVFYGLYKVGWDIDMIYRAFYVDRSSFREVLKRMRLYYTLPSTSSSNGNEKHEVGIAGKKEGK